MRTTVLIALLAGASCWGQQAGPGAARRAVNPLAGKLEAIAAGEKQYDVRCAQCHGKGAKGGEAPSLHRSRIVVVSPPARFFDVIRKGIPGSGMPPFAGEDEKIWQIVSYVYSITKPGQGPPVPGDPEAGAAVFRRAGCMNCHTVDGAGGALGPDLSSIALQRSSADIRNAVLRPNAKIAEGFQAVRLLTRDGKKLEGVLKNRDNFSVQMIASDGTPKAFLTRELAKVEVQHGRSLMPHDIAASLSEQELQNLLAFLDRRRKPYLRTHVNFQNY